MIDVPTLKELVKDTRIWVSYARVDLPTEEEGGQVVEFDEEDGQLYVNTTLLPHNIPCRARLGMLFAGPGEAGYVSPYAGGEEVVVVLPEGTPKAGGVILARLNNAYDSFPFESVAGQDPTTNSLGVIRMKNAITIESGASVMLRSAAAGAFVRVDGRGNITLRDADANVLQVSPDVFGYQNGAGDVVQQLDLNGLRSTLQIGQAALVLAGDSGGQFPQSYLQTPSTMTLATGGLSMNTAAEHVLTTEQVVNILANVLPLVLAAALPAVAWVPPPPDPTSPFYAAMAAGLTAASQSTLNPTVAAVLFGLFSAPVLKPPPTPGFGQLAPGIGCQGLISG